MKNTLNEFKIKRGPKKYGKNLYDIHHGEKYITTVHGSKNVRAWLTAEVMSKAPPVVVSKGK